MVRYFSGSETSESFNWLAWGGRNPWNILQIWTLLTLWYFLSGAWKSPISKVVIMKTNEDSKLLLFYLIFGGVGGCCMFYLSAWSTTLTCLIVGRVELYVRVEVFPPIFKIERSKQNDTLKPLKFSLKMVGPWLNGRVGVWVMDKLIFHAECNSENFGLSFYLIYIA